MALSINGTVVVDNSRNAYLENFAAVGTPTNLDPTSGETGVALNGLVLYASPYAGLYQATVTHYASRWQVANASSFATNNIVVDSGNVTPGSNTYTISTSLPGDTVLYWRVNYVNNSNVVSSFSNTTSFTTGPAPPSVLGQSYGGGYYTGTIDIGGGVCYYLIVAPNATGCAFCILKTTNTTTSGVDSLNDGYANTYGPMDNASHPAGNWTATRSIGGFSDWYLPAKNELQAMWTNRGSMPAGEGYTLSTSAYWASTQYSATCGCYLNFPDGAFGCRLIKVDGARVRAIRRVSF